MTEQDTHLKAVGLELFLAVLVQMVESLFPSSPVVKHLQLSFASMCMKYILIRYKC